MVGDIEYFTDLKTHVVFILNQDYLLVVIQNEQALRHSLKIILYVIVIGLKGYNPASRKLINIFLFYLVRLRRVKLYFANLVNTA